MNNRMAYYVVLIGWFAENLVGFGFLSVVCLLYETNPYPRKNICCGKKLAKMPPFTYFFLGWVGLGLGSSSVS